MKRLRNIRFAHVAGCLFLFAALGVLACLLYPELEWRHRMTKMLRDAPYVKLYNPDYELVVTIEDRGTIQRLWAAMDLWKRESATADGELIQVGCIQYPTELEWEPGVPFEFPITLYADGRALWGLTPDSRHWFWSKELRDEVVRLLEQHLPESEKSSNGMHSDGNSATLHSRQ